MIELTQSKMKELNQYVPDIHMFEEHHLPFCYASRRLFFVESVWKNDTDEFIANYDDNLMLTSNIIDEFDSQDIITPAALLDLIGVKIVKSREGNKHYAVTERISYNHWLPGYWEESPSTIMIVDPNDYAVLREEVRKAQDFTLGGNDLNWGYDASAMQSTFRKYYHPLLVPDMVRRVFFELLFERIEEEWELYKKNNM